MALTHLGANLDSWDPELVDPLALHRRVILLGYRGVGASTGTVRVRFEDMAADGIAAVRALGLSRVFCTRTPAGREAARTYHARLKLRRTDRDKPVTPGVFRAQLRAVKRWGEQTPPASPFTQPVLILHGDRDRMVPVANADVLLAGHPDANVRVFADSGHGVAFQNRHSVADTVTAFLQR